jgi:hypothetical protein
MSLFSFSLDNFKQMMSGSSISSINSAHSSSQEDEALKRSRLFTYLAAYACELEDISQYILSTKMDKPISKTIYAKYLDVLRKSVLSDLPNNSKIETIDPMFKFYYMLGGHFLSFLEVSALLENLNHVEVVFNEKGAYARVLTKYKLPINNDNINIFNSMAIVKLISFIERNPEDILEFKKASRISDEDFDMFIRLSIAIFATSFYTKGILDIGAVDGWINKHNLTKLSSFDDIRKAVGE